MVGMPYAWNSTTCANRVMPRDGDNSDVRWFEIEPCYVYHPLNAYSEFRDGARGTEEVLVLDVVRYSRMFDRDRRGPGDSLPTLDRWTINLTTGAVATECRDDRSQEFPRINETLLGGRHRFGYTVGIEGGSSPQANRTCRRRCTSTTTRPGRVRSPRSIPICSSGDVLHPEPAIRFGAPLPWRKMTAS